MGKGNFISKDEAVIIQAFAVLMMVFHHLFTFPERIAFDYVSFFDFPSIHFELIFAAFCKICVAVFAFSSGYGLYKLASNKFTTSKYDLGKICKSSAKRVLNFYSIYWTVFILLIPYGFYIGAFKFIPLTFVKNVFAISINYNGEWWYATYYLIFLILFPILFYFIKRFNAKFVYLIWIAITLATTCLIFLNLHFGKPVSTRVVTYLFCFLWGSLFVKYSVFEKADKIIKKSVITKIAFALIVCIVMVVRLRFITNYDYDYVFVPFLIYAMLCLIKAKWFNSKIKCVFMFIGKYTTYIWLVHTFFAYYYFQELTYMPKYSLLIFIWDVVLSLATGILLNIIHSFIMKLIGKLHRKHQLA